ncbi:MAG: ABC transporter ATP-binding protein [Deltaproteobacteria bacterium]|jgi:iron complex transport system ATP-binding protein|nr:ABC transporter ATP-binding protein [Deltaproteobacteria bacterium]
MEVRDLSVGYGKPVLAGLNLEIRAGSLVSLLGPNGAGKTTLLRTLSKRLQPLSGSISLKGRLLSDYRADELAKIISVVLTDRAAPPMLSVLEYVALGRHPHLSLFGRLSEADIRAVERALAAVKAEDLSSKFVDRLSDGERQKAALARALAQEPELMLLDEPTAHLDLKHRLEVMSILRSLCAERGLAVLAAVHDVDLAAKVSDLVATVRDGSLAAFGRPEVVLSAQAVSGLYDLKRAGFSNHLGGVEVRSDGRAGRAFVVSKLDRSAMAMRLLSKRGWSLSAGLMDKGDLDAHVAEALGGEVFGGGTGEAAEADLERAMKALGGCSLVVDGLGTEGTEGDKALVAEAKRRGLKVLRLEGSDLGSFLTALDALAG